LVRSCSGTFRGGLFTVGLRIGQGEYLLDVSLVRFLIYVYIFRSPTDVVLVIANGLSRGVSWNLGVASGIPLVHIVHLAPDHWDSVASSRLGQLLAALHASQRAYFLIF